MSHKDDELNELLGPLKALQPNDLQMQKWQNAMKRAARPAPQTRTKWLLQLAVATVIGFIMGVVVVKGTASSSLIAQISDDNATFERSYVNLD